MIIWKYVNELLSLFSCEENILNLDWIQLRSVTTFFSGKLLFILCHPIQLNYSSNATLLVYLNGVKTRLDLFYA